MAKTKIKKISVLEKHQRLDGDVDHLMKLDFVDETHVYLPVRVTSKEAYSFMLVENDKQHEPKKQWVKIPKKRTVHANARLLYQSHPHIASKSTSNFYRLTEDDRSLRHKAILAKRQWKVHEVATFADRFFVARLSCSRQEKLLHEYTQYILYPSPLSDLTSQSTLHTWDIYTKHGGFISAVKIRASQLRYALRENNWHLLSGLLADIEQGYNTELEAKSGFEHVISKQSQPPIQRHSFGKQNSVRQVHVDKDLVIKFIDEYQGANNKSWLFSSNERYYIMEMDRNTAGKVVLHNMSVSTAFETELQAAKQLVSQAIAKYSSRYLTVGYSLEQAKELWQQLIERDAHHRQFCEQLIDILP